MLYALVIMLGLQLYRAQAVKLSNIELPVDQYGEKLITGEASALVWEGGVYFYVSCRQCGRKDGGRRDTLLWSTPLSPAPSRSSPLPDQSKCPHHGTPHSSTTGGRAQAWTAATATRGARRAASTIRRTRCKRAAIPTSMGTPSRRTRPRTFCKTSSQLSKRTERLKLTETSFAGRGKTSASRFPRRTVCQGSSLGPALCTIRRRGSLSCGTKTGAWTRRATQWPSRKRPAGRFGRRT